MESLTTNNHLTTTTNRSETAPDTLQENNEGDRKKSIEEMKSKNYPFYSLTIKERLRLQLNAFSEPMLFSYPSQERPQDNNITTKLRISALKRKIEDSYKQLETLGQGSFGVVKKVLQLQENKIYAAKMMRSADHEHLEQAKKEYQILSRLQHKNIIGVKELFYDEALGNAQLIIEYFPGKTLEEMIKEQGRIEEEKVRRIIEQVISALKYIHDKGVCHRDINASNILVNENYEVRLIDFSISKINKEELWSPTASNTATVRKGSILPSNYQNFMFSDAGTDFYKAPEIITGVPYTQSVDIWSLGVTTFYALAGKRPFQSSK